MYILEWLLSKRQEITSIGENMEKRECLITVGIITMEKSMEISQNLSIYLPYDPALWLLGIYMKNIKIINVKRYVHSYLHCSITYVSEDMDGPWAIILSEISQIRKDTVHGFTQRKKLKKQ